VNNTFYIVDSILNINIINVIYLYFLKNKNIYK
jgi:hypothetical protein